MKLNELELLTGFQGKESPGEIYKIISMSDLDINGKFEYSNLGNIECENVKPKYLLRKGDLILKARGGENTIAIIDKNYDNLLVTAHFIIIRIKDFKELNPYYLHLYLNSKRVKKHMKDGLIGTYQKSLKIKDIEDIEIPKLSFRKQSRLGEMNRLGIEERMMSEQYFILRDKLFESKLEEEIMEELEYVNYIYSK